MTDTLRTVVYLGNRAQADTLEGDQQYAVENTDALKGTYTAKTLKVVTVTNNDVDGAGGSPDGMIYEDVR